MAMKPSADRIPIHSIFATAIRRPMSPTDYNVYHFVF